MEREDILKFTNSIILLSKLSTTIKDRFLKQKLHIKISDFVSKFVEQKSPPFFKSHNVKDLISSINNLLDYVEQLAHISEGGATPLLLVQRNLLKFKLSILKQRPIATKLTGDKDESKDLVAPEISLKSTISKHKIIRRVLKTDSNKERIFNFVKRTPDVRAKDIMSEFNALSGRTVKRNLKELIDEGLLDKKSDGVAVYYLATK